MGESNKLIGGYDLYNEEKFGVKHLMMVFMAFTLLFATVGVTNPDSADARRGGGFKSGTKIIPTHLRNPTPTAT